MADAEDRFQDYLRRTKLRSQEHVKTFNRKIDGIAQSMHETIGEDALNAKIGRAWDGPKKRVSQKIGKIIYDEDGKVQKVVRYYNESKVKHTIDGAGQMTEWIIGDVTKLVVGALGAAQTEANFIENKTALARNALMGPLNILESGIIAATTTPAGIEMGTSFGGLLVNGAAVVKFNPGTCFNIGKAIQSLLKLIQIVKKLLNKLKIAQIVPGLKALIKKIKLLDKVINLPCVDLKVGASAGVAAFNDLPKPSAPGEASKISWGLVPTPPPAQTTT